jgi:RNA polymerase sigma-70 factor (ECF subfamily)
MAKNSSQSSLIHCLISGEKDAFERLVQLFRKKILGTIYSFTHNVDDSEDIAQEVFLEIYRSIHLFHGDKSLNSWIYRITVNKSIEFLRRKKAAKRNGFMISLSDQFEYIESMISDCNHAGVKMEEREKSHILNSAINNLPANQKAAFNLHCIEGLSYKEIAKILHSTPSAVQSLIFRAKQNLRKSLNHYKKV